MEIPNSEHKVSVSTFRMIGCSVGSGVTLQAIADYDYGGVDLPLGVQSLSTSDQKKSLHS